MLADTSYPSIQDTKAEESQVHGQPGICSWMLQKETSQRDTERYQIMNL